MIRSGALQVKHIGGYREKGPCTLFQARRSDQAWCFGVSVRVIAGGLAHTFVEKTTGRTVLD
jgi:hypothetical protein